MPCFSELYCRRHHIRPDKYVDAMFWRCLRPRAWLFAFFAKHLAPDYFQPDFELIRSIGRIHSRRQVDDELADYAVHPGNHGLFRHRLKLRLSGRRVYRVVAETISGERAASDGSMPPSSRQS